MREADPIYHHVGTSWLAVICGWLTMVGVAAILTPAVSAFLGRPDVDVTSTNAAMPVLLALVVASFFGGHMAGRAAGHHTSWHGVLAGALTMLVSGIYLLLQVAGQQQMLGFTYYTFPEVFPQVLTVGLYQSPLPLAVGALAMLPAHILPAWLGGLLAPTHLVGVQPRRPEPAVRTDSGRRAHPAV